MKYEKTITASEVAYRHIEILKLFMLIIVDLCDILNLYFMYGEEK